MCGVYKMFIEKVGFFVLCTLHFSDKSYNGAMFNFFFFFQKMADSPGFFFIFEKNCNGQDMRRIFQKFKRKYIHLSQKNATELEDATATPVKRKRVCKNHGDESVHKTLENKSEDRRCDIVALKDHISEKETVKKWNGSISKRKLNSRLSRILKVKLSTVDIHRDSIDSCDTDSKLSADSGIKCENYVATQNVDTTVTLRKQSDIVAMDCEFVGVGPQRKNALGEVFSVHAKFPTVYTFCYCYSTN